MCAPLPATVLRIVLSAGLVTQTTGCSRWSVQPGTAIELIESSHPDKVQIRRYDGERVVLKRPWVDGDSLVSAGRKDTTRVALVDVNTVAVRRFAPLKTVGFTVLVVGATFVLACAAVCDFGQIGFGGWGY